MIDGVRCIFHFLILVDFKMGKNKDRKKKGVAIQKTATKTKKKTEKELQKQIEQLGEVKFLLKLLFYFF
jgi:hypothetical protein